MERTSGLNRNRLTSQAATGSQCEIAQAPALLARSRFATLLVGPNGEEHRLIKAAELRLTLLYGDG